MPAHARLQALGYREKEKVGADDPMGGGGALQLESTDDFLARVQVQSCATMFAKPGNQKHRPSLLQQASRLACYMLISQVSG